MFTLLLGVSLTKRRFLYISLRSFGMRHVLIEGMFVTVSFIRQVCAILQALEHLGCVLPKPSVCFALACAQAVDRLCHRDSSSHLTATKPIRTLKCHDEVSFWNDNSLDAATIAVPMTKLPVKRKGFYLNGSSG